MSKKTGLVVALAGVCALSLFLLSCGSSSSRPSGLLYVLTEGSTGIGNNITSYAIDLRSGGLSLINSNASTCGSGLSCGAPLSIVLDPTGATAFVLNQGIASASVAPTIYPYTVNSDGSFSAPGTSVTWNCIVGTGGSCYPDTPSGMARDAAGQFLFVIDQGSSPSLTTCPLVGRGVSNPTDAVNFAGCPSIAVFSVTPGSTTLTFVSQSTTYQSPFFVSKIPTGLSAITLASSPGEVLFVSSSQDVSANHNDNTLSVYGVGSDGTLSEKTGSPYATSTILPQTVLAVNTNASGSGGVFAYVGAAGNAAGAVDAFQMCTAVTPTCTQTDVDNAKLFSVGNPTTAGQNPQAMVVDPTNQFLYVVAEQSSQIFGFKINPTSGILTPLSPASLPTGTNPVALAIHSTGQFLYTSNSNSDNISAFTLSLTNGSMATAATVNAPSAPSGMTAR